MSANPSPTQTYKSEQGGSIRGVGGVKVGARERTCMLKKALIKAL